MSFANKTLTGVNTGVLNEISTIKRGHNKRNIYFHKKDISGNDFFANVESPHGKMMLLIQEGTMLSRRSVRLVHVKVTIERGGKETKVYNILLERVSSSLARFKKCLSGYLDKNRTFSELKETLVFCNEKSEKHNNKEKYFQFIFKMNDEKFKENFPVEGIQKAHVIADICGMEFVPDLVSKLKDAEFKKKYGSSTRQNITDKMILLVQGSSFQNIATA